MAESNHASENSASDVGEMFDAGAQMVERYWRATENALTAWETSGLSFLNDLARDYGKAVEGLGAARSPAEILAVEQNLLLARLGALLAMGTEAQAAWNTSLGERAPFPLPD